MASDLTRRPAARFFFALALAATSLWSGPGAAQPAAIVPDATMGTQVGNGGLDYLITAGRLSASGTNLFHSFTRFNVPTGGSATFDGPGSVVNILSRVTGPMEVSTIDGLISTRGAMPTANFFLINPSGVVIGANAFLDVGGSFRVSTADYIRFEDGGIFSATPGTGDALLSSAAPTAFGFLGSNPAPITVEGAFLVVDPGQTITLVGGDVTLQSGMTTSGDIFGAEIGAPGGVVQIGSAASPNEAVFSGPDLNMSSFARQGRVTISEGSLVRVDGDPNGSIVIRGGQLVIDNNSILLSRTFDVAGAAVGIDLAGTDSILITNGASVRTTSAGLADASNILISGGNLTVSNGAFVESIAGQAGRSGAIDIRVVNADIVDGGRIRTTSSASAAGNVTIAASGTVTVAGATSEISSDTLSGDPTVFGGNILLTVRDLVLRDQGRIRSGGLGGQQAGERVSITATNSITISSLAGIASNAFAQTAGAIDVSASQLIMDAGFINTSTLGFGGAGQILVNANTISLTNGAQIASNSQSVATGSGGSITINAPGSLTISGIAADAGVGDITFSGSANSGLFSTTEGRGNAGQISVSTPALTLADGGRISVATEGAGNAGTIVANVGSFSISGGGRVDSSTIAGGDGGAITANGTLAISGAGSGLFSTASSTGNAGAINATGPNLTVTGGGTIDSSTTGAGAGGAINLSAASQVEIASGGSIRADSLGSGLTGNITVAAGDRIMMNNGSISTRAVTSDGGNITLRAPNIIRLGNSQITTSVQSGTGGGGNIFIDPQFVILQGSTITANAFGGPGGSITIIADNFLSDATSSVTASSALSTPGTVTIQSPENNLKEAIAQLPGDLVDASRLLRGACSARQTGAPSSFAVAGRGGVPADADGYLSSFSTTGAPLARAARQEQHDQGVVLAMASLDCAR